MQLTAPTKGNSGGGKIAPQGLHVAVCYQIIHFGKRFDTRFNQTTDKIQFLFELSDELEVFDEKKGPQPYYVKAVMNRYMGKNKKTKEGSALRKFIEGWNGSSFTNEDDAEKFNLFSMIGKPCMVNVIHEVGNDGNTYTKIASIAPLMKNIQAPKQINESLMFSPCFPDLKAFEKLPEFIRKMVEESDEWNYFKANASQQPTPSFQQERTAHQRPAAKQQQEEDFFLSDIDNDLPY
jgi:hypothetical protein